MSARCTAEVFARYPAGGGEFTLALSLADNAHDDGTRIFPSIATMARKSRQTERSVITHLRRMVAVGWLQVVRQGGGRGRYTEYRINERWLKGEEIAPFNSHGWILEKVKTSARNHEIQRVETMKFDAQKGESGDTTKGTDLTVKGNTPLPPGGGVSAFGELVATYPRRRADESRAAIVWARLECVGDERHPPGEQLARTIVDAARALAATEEWSRLDGQYAPKLSKWLRNQGWKQAPTAAAPAVSTAPPPPQSPDLTPEQMARNKERARELRDRVKRLNAEARIAKGQPC